MVNTRFAIYGRQGAKLSGGSLRELTGYPDSNSFLTDPQVIWDPDTRRFFYVVLDADSHYKLRSNHIDFLYGFSKTSFPTGAQGWCKYRVAFGYDSGRFGQSFLPDYPKLGDTKHFVAWGVNTFSVAEGQYVGSDIDWIRKPGLGPITSCPSRLTGGARTNLEGPSGGPAWTPVVANQTDGSARGWAVATKFPAAGAANSLFVFALHETGTALRIPQRGSTIFAPKYAFPPNAAQAGTTARFDTSDTRLTQAVSAVDPFRGYRTAIWTQHTVRAGTTSGVRWYEIDPAGKHLMQTGLIALSGFYVFNGSISPDRLNDGVHHRFGDAMAMSVNASSSSHNLAIGTLEKIRNRARTPVALVKQSAAHELGPDCSDGVCRWGDYAAATPDPNADPSAGRGLVWFTSTHSAPGSGRGDIDWRTMNWTDRL
jgi:hypothetical protein